MEAQVGGIKALTAQLKGLTDCDESYEAAEPVWKLLMKVIQKHGDVASAVDEPHACMQCANFSISLPFSLMCPPTQFRC